MQKNLYSIFIYNVTIAVKIEFFKDEEGSTITVEHATSVSEIHIPILESLKHMLFVIKVSFY